MFKVIDLDLGRTGTMSKGHKVYFVEIKRLAHIGF